MKMIFEYFVCLIILFSTSCQSQSRIDLSELTLSEDFLVMVPKSERTFFYSDKIDPATGTPSYTTNEVQKYSYKNVLFEQTKIGMSQVTFYTYKALEKGGNNQIFGLHFNIEEKNEELFTILKKQYGDPKELNAAPTQPKDEILYGHHSFVWNEDKISIILSYSYSSFNDKQHIQTAVYILKNDAKDLTFPKRTSVKRLMQTHTKK
ncbi:hypothetical protein [Aquimarina aquimarini]|uniref:hypothetical protein n=1 Tax=Aquimarina aquimarini TaxID=1191734 RepID=UPI00131F2C2A|nr:hypothetical protein [Aquimarina aquimarini]